MKSAVGPGSVARAWAALIGFVLVLVFLTPYPVIAWLAPILRVLGLIALTLGLLLAFGVILVLIVSGAPSTSVKDYDS